LAAKRSHGGHHKQIVLSPLPDRRVERQSIWDDPSICRAAHLRWKIRVGIARIGVWDFLLRNPANDHAFYRGRITP
jgi:hypothetical protein